MRNRNLMDNLLCAMDWEGKKPLIDSRMLFDPEQTVFFALKGRHTDGHKFVASLYERGVRDFVVSQPVESLPGARILTVSDPVSVLQQWACRHRARLNCPVIAITGSNGKTIVKEWLFELLSPYFSIIKSPKSYNSQLGVPLSVLEAAPRHTLAIFEAGISQPGEMKRLADILKPDFGIFTNVGTAHSENFASQSEKIAEKMLLFEGCRRVICSESYPEIIKEAQKRGIALYIWGVGRDCDLRIRTMSTQNHSLSLELSEKGKPAGSVCLPFTDSPSIENVLHCVAAMRLLGIDFAAIAKGVQLLQNLPMRLSIKDGGSCILIDDTYNNDLQGLGVALSFLQQKAGGQPKTLILSDLAGEASPVEAVASLVKSSQITRLIAVGKKLSQHRDKFKPIESVFFERTEDLLAALPGLTGFVLVKGAREFGFERVVRAYEAKLHATRLEINLSALAHNFNVYKALLRPTTRTMAMVKAFAYGAGSIEIAKVLEYNGVDYLAVAFVDEGIALRKAGIKIPIMVMNPQPETFPAYQPYRLEPELYSFDLLRKWTAGGYTSPFHLKINTGMNRLGFSRSEWPQLAAWLKENPELKPASVFSHLAASGSEQYRDFTLAQIADFQTAVSMLAIGSNTLLHIANTDAIGLYPQAEMDMVRLGIGLYGISAGRERTLLKTVSTLKTTVSQVRKISPGESVGYQRGFIAQRPTEVATIAIGYADGFDRRNSLGVGKVFIRGKAAPVLGYVCMDMAMVDTTEIGAEAGDEVVIFGENPSAEQVAAAIGTIPYEVLTSVNERVKRIFFED